MSRWRPVRRRFWVASHVFALPGRARSAFALGTRGAQGLLLDATSSPPPEPSHAVSSVSPRVLFAAARLSTWATWACSSDDSTHVSSAAPLSSAQRDELDAYIGSARHGGLHLDA